MKMRFLLLLSCLIYFPFCTNDDDDFIAIPNVDAELQPYFRAFEAEAHKRGIPITLEFSTITAHIEQIRESDIAGECWYNSHLPNEIIIDVDYWNTSSDILREFVVMHELGHCYLDRDHLDARATDDSCISVMASGVSGCINKYSARTREAYLDELFWGN